MKRLAALAALAGCLAAGPAAAAGIGIGAFGGLSFPVVQDDNNGQGSVFGVRAPISLVPMFTVEPYFTSTSGGDTEETFGGVGYTRSGIDVTGFGANVLLTMGTGLRFYPFAGIGSYSMERPGLDESNMGWTAGFGIGFTPPIAGLGIDLRGELTGVLEDGDETSRTWANVTVGVSYSLFNLPTP